MEIQIKDGATHYLDALMAKAVDAAKRHGVYEYVELLRQQYPAACHRLRKMAEWEAESELDRMEQQMTDDLSRIAGGIRRVGTVSTAHMQQHQQMLANASTSTITTGTGLLQNMQNMQNMQNAYPATAKDFVPALGVLYMNGAELPADWSGAKITEFKRSALTKFWQVSFTSKWDKALQINLYLSLEELNGKEVNETATTYMEALNQRRVG